MLRHIQAATLAALASGFVVAPAPSVAQTAAPAAQPAAVEPAALVEGLYRDAIAGRDPFGKATRERFLSRRLLRLIAEDERASARAKEPGKIEFDLLTGGQDKVIFGSLQVNQLSRQGDKASVRARFRNVAFPDPPPAIETVTYRLESGDRGWRIVDIVYKPDFTLLGTLTR
jgi:hypothetical protein